MSIVAITGTLEDFYETGMEAVEYSMIDFAMPSYDGLNTFSDGDELEIYTPEGSLVWSGIISKDNKINKKIHPVLGYKVQVSNGMVVDWIQKGMDPDEWGSFFEGNKVGRLFVDLSKKQSRYNSLSLHPFYVAANLIMYEDPEFTLSEIRDKAYQLKNTESRQRERDNLWHAACWQARLIGERFNWTSSYFADVYKFPIGQVKSIRELPNDFGTYNPDILVRMVLVSALAKAIEMHFPRSKNYNASLSKLTDFYQVGFDPTECLLEDDETSALKEIMKIQWNHFI